MPPASRVVRRSLKRRVPGPVLRPHPMQCSFGCVCMTIAVPLGGRQDHRGGEVALSIGLAPAKPDEAGSSSVRPSSALPRLPNRACGCRRPTGRGEPRGLGQRRRQRALVSGIFAFAHSMNGEGRNRHHPATSARRCRRQMSGRPLRLPTSAYRRLIVPSPCHSRHSGEGGGAGGSGRLTAAPFAQNDARRP